MSGKTRGLRVAGMILAASGMVALLPAAANADGGPPPGQQGGGQQGGGQQPYGPPVWCPVIGTTIPQGKCDEVTARANDDLDKLKTASKESSESVAATLECNWDWQPNKDANWEIWKQLRGTGNACEVLDKPGTTPAAGCRKLVFSRTGKNSLGWDVWSVEGEFVWCWGKNKEGKHVVLSHSGYFAPAYGRNLWYAGWHPVPPGNPSQPGDDMNDPIDGGGRLEFYRKLHLVLDTAIPLVGPVTFEHQYPSIRIEVTGAGGFKIKGN